jgi:hypothetical protein
MNKFLIGVSGQLYCPLALVETGMPLDPDAAELMYKIVKQGQANINGN